MFLAPSQIGRSSSYSTATSVRPLPRIRWRWTALAALSLLGASALLSEPLRADHAKKNKEIKWPLTRDDIGIICVIGEHSDFVQRPKY